MFFLLFFYQKFVTVAVAVVLSVVASPILCLHLQTVQLYNPAVFCNKHPDGGRPTPSSPVILFSSLHSPRIFEEHMGQLRMRSCLQLPSSLSTESLFPQSFSLAFCQFSRLSNELSDRSKSSGWDLGSLRKLGMLQWRIWRLHGNMQQILSFGLLVCVLYLTVYLAVIQSTGLSISVRQFVCSVHDWSQVYLKCSSILARS